MIPYIGEIRMFGGSFAPDGWFFCNGQLLSISEYETLFALIGTTYGGDGQTTFALPNLQGRIPIGQGPSSVSGTNYLPGQMGGTENVTLLSTQLPTHTHPAAASSAAGAEHSPENTFWAAGLNEFSTGNPDGAMKGGSIGAAGGSQPHNNMMPYTCVSFIISWKGEWPSQE